MGFKRGRGFGARSVKVLPIDVFSVAYRGNKDRLLAFHLSLCRAACNFSTVPPIFPVSFKRIALTLGLAIVEMAEFKDPSRRTPEALQSLIFFFADLDDGKTQHVI